MLRELTIQNLAIIDALNVSFAGGFNIISGETGAGKSIIIGAIGLLLGERASSDLIRSSEDSAVIEALFDIRERGEIKEKLRNMGYGEEDELIVRRVVSRSGKNRVYINGSLATLGTLTSVSESLVNICSQHEHQTILNPDTHIDILDEFGGLMQPRDAFAVLYSEYRSLEDQLDRLKAMNRKKIEREEFLTFQLKEINDGTFSMGEDAELLNEKKVLNNARKLAEHALNAYELLYAREDSILETVSMVLRDVKEIQQIDEKCEISPRDIDAIYFALEEVAFSLRDYKNRITVDPERLEIIDDRLECLGRLKRKHGGTLESVLKKKSEIEKELAEILSVDDQIARITGESVEKKRQMLDKARALSAKRTAVAAKLKEEIEQEIRTLKMADTTFGVRFFQPPTDSDGDPVAHARGIGTVEFYLSTNIGEETKPLNRIASGGELSRIVLAMKKVLARTGSVSTVIFDEVDAGIGGAIAEVVGRKLHEVSEHHQVICISHLPQIACFGDHHFLVSKHIVGDRTNAVVRVLTDEERLEEITRMLGGVEITETTREHAYEMLKTIHSE